MRNCGKRFSQLFNRKSLKFSQTVSCWSPCLTSKAAFILSSFNTVLKTIVSEAESVMGGIIVDYFQVLADFKILLNCQKPLALFYQFVFGNSMIRRAYYSCLQYRTKINPCVLTHQRRRVWNKSEGFLTTLLPFSTGPRGEQAEVTTTLFIVFN